MKFNLVFATLLLLINLTCYSQIEKKYRDLGGEKGLLGKPRSEVMFTPDHSGKFRLFEGGNIYWKKKVGAFAVQGKILGKYGNFEFEQGFLGYPVSDERWTPDRSGVFQLFEHGSIYYKEGIGAFAVQGSIRKKWGDHKYEQGILGFPVSDEKEIGDGRGRMTEFEGGIVVWSQETGAHMLYGGILSYLKKASGTHGTCYPVDNQSKLKYPVTDVKKVRNNPTVKDQVICEFEGGKVIFPSPRGPEWCEVYWNNVKSWIPIITR